MAGVTAKVIGADELRRALTELTAMNGPQWRAALRSAVRTPMNQVKSRAKANIAAISPGKTPLHRTYRGRLVSAGFASRNLRVIVKFAKDRSSVSAILGTRAEAFYATQFFELGTAKIPRKPWLVPALEGSKDSAVKEVGWALRRRIDAIAKKAAAASAAKSKAA